MRAAGRLCETIFRSTKSRRCRLQPPERVFFVRPHETAIPREDRSHRAINLLPFRGFLRRGADAPLPATAASHELEHDKKQDSTDGRLDDCRDYADTQVNAQLGQQPTPD
jgi:hypothetical protein